MGKKAFQLSLLVFLASFLFLNQKKLVSQLKNSEASAFTPYLTRDVWGLATLGFKDFFDDLLFVWSLEELGQEKQLINKKELKKRVELFVRLEPRIETFYTLTCFVFLFELDEPRACERFLQVGYKVFPDRWRVPFSLGYLYAFRFQDYSKGAHYYTEASKLRGAPEYLKPLSEKLLRGEFRPIKPKLFRKLLIEED